MDESGLMEELVLGDRVPQLVRWVVRGVGLALLGVGVCAWVSMFAAHGGVFGEMRRVEWPVPGWASMVRLADGRYAVMVETAGRVQVYGADRRFQYGWQVPGGNPVLASGPGGEVEVWGRLKHGDRYELAGVYAADGTPLARVAARIGTKVTGTPAGMGAEQGGVIPMAWWAWPFSGPIRAWLCMPVGGVLSVVFLTREQVGRMRRKWEAKQRAKAGG